MRTGRDQQSLSYPLRLPDTVQANALRLLDVSRLVINATVIKWGVRSSWTPGLLMGDKPAPGGK